MKIKWTIGVLLLLTPIMMVGLFSKLRYSTASTTGGRENETADAISASTPSHLVRDSSWSRAVVARDTWNGEQKPPVFSSDALVNEYAVAHQLLIDKFGPDEADFRVALGENVGDWETLKSMVIVRDQATGQNHSRILFDVGMATGAITRAELTSMLEQGAVTADEAFEQSVFYANTDMLGALLDLGLSMDFAAAHPVTGEDAVGTFVRRVGWQPTETDLPTALSTIGRLVQMGANPTVGLNAALRGVNPSNASNSFEIASALRAQGGVADPSIRQHIERLRDDGYRRKFLEFFE